MAIVTRDDAELIKKLYPHADHAMSMVAGTTIDEGKRITDVHLYCVTCHSQLMRLAHAEREAVV